MNHNNNRNWIPHSKWWLGRIKFLKQKIWFWCLSCSNRKHSKGDWFFLFMLRMPNRERRSLLGCFPSLRYEFSIVAGRVWDTNNTFIPKSKLIDIPVVPSGGRRVASFFPCRPFPPSLRLVPTYCLVDRQMGEAKRAGTCRNGPGAWDLCTWDMRSNQYGDCPSQLYP